MSRKTPYSSAGLPFSIGSRCINKDWFGMPLEEVWSIFEDVLIITVAGYNLKINSFVLMSNHFHMIASAPDDNLSSAMQYLLSQTSRLITKSAERVNHTWKAKYFRSCLSKHHYFLNSYKYIYRNPVEAGICNLVEEYPYSTLSGLLGFRRISIPLVSDETLFSDVEGTIKWLNTPVAFENRVAMSRALKKSSYKLPKLNGFLHPLENTLL